VPCGTTGENSTLSNAEHHRVIEVCVEQAAGRVPVIAGCGSNDTMNAHLHMTFSKKCGAQAALRGALLQPAEPGRADRPFQLSGRKQRPADHSLQRSGPHGDRHPARDGVRAGQAFPERIVGIKDASGDLSRVTDHRMGIGKHFCQLSGDDELALPANAAGAVGCISVTANVAPKLCAEFQAACAANDLALARELNDKLYPLHYAMFEDASPGPVKYALSRVHDWMNEDMRLPLVPCSDAARKAVMRRWNMPD
jgi:4-hydroxy-tetrahydrodipicolinate synthase